MAFETGVLEQGVIKPIAGKRSAQLNVDILIAIVVNIGERYSVPFLQVPEAARHCDVREAFPLLIQKHEVRHDFRERHVTGSQIEVQESVVIQVAKVGSHRTREAGQLLLASDIQESSLAVSLVQAHQFSRDIALPVGNGIDDGRVARSEWHQCQVAGVAV